MIGRPEASEAASYYWKYIDRVSGDDILAYLSAQLDATLARLGAIGEEQSLSRYAPGKWSIRELWNHVNDTERVFLSRAVWFARKLEGALLSFEQDLAAAAAEADRCAWSSHVEEFRAVRLSTLAFFRNLPPEAWMRNGVASGNPVTVRALAYIIGGHAAHHEAVLADRYL